MAPRHSKRESESLKPLWPPRKQQFNRYSPAVRFDRSLLNAAAVRHDLYELTRIWIQFPSRFVTIRAIRV
jgi:hypothetical protein